MVENISPRQTWDALCSDARAKLVDVRTVPEWDNIGIPDLAAAGKAPALVSWQTAPAMQVNRRFIEEMKQAGRHPGRPYLLPVPQRRAQPGRGQCGAGGGLRPCVQHRRRVRGPA